MKLIARIDANGRCFIGMHGRDNAWVKSGNTKPVTLVRNERGGDEVTLEDIGYAQLDHKIQNAGEFFASDDVMKYFLK